MPSERAVSASPRFHEDIHVMPEVGQEIYPNTRSSWTSENHQLGPHPSLSKPLTSFSPRKTVMSGIQRESSLFSSSFSELFSRKLQLMRNNGPPSQSANIVASHLEEEETFQSLEQTEAQTIGNLLPDEDDFFNGLVDEAGHNSHTSKVDDMDDFDLFSSGGGMELEANVLSAAGQINSGSPVGVSDGRRVASGLLVGEHPDGEVPSRTLFVQNIHNNVKDSDLKVLFEQFGDIRALYTASKNRGFVMVSYYDIRAAQNAMRLLRRRRLDIHYSFPKENPSEGDINRDTLLVSNLDSSISDDDVHKILGVYGEIREICDTTGNNSQKFVEFFDVRAADAARLSLNGIEIAGKQIKLEPSGSRSARSFLPQYGQEDAEPRLVQRSFKNSSSPHIGRISPAIFASSSMNAGPVHVFPNLVHSPANSFSEPNQIFSIPTGLSSSTRVMSNGKIIGIQEPSFSFDEKMGNHSLSNLHSHSFPEFHDNFPSNSSYKSSKTFAEMVGSGQNLNEDFINSSIRSAGSNGHQIGFNGGVMGSSLKESSLHGNPWNNLNSQQQRLSTPMVWPNSPSYIDGIHSRIPHVAAFSRAPPVMVNASSSPVHHHIGSAPAMNHTFWDMKHAYDPESLESSSFNLGSHGRFGNSPSHPLDIASHNIFTHLGGGRMDVNPANPVPCSPQQMSHFFPGRNPMISAPGSYGSPNERFRNLSQRRNDSSSNNADKKLYELDIDRILNGEDSRTTLMIKNIPNKYTSKMLLAAIDEYCKGTYDFIYLPIDFKNKCNVGYAFINLIDPQKIVPFHKAFNGKKWEKFNSEKVASLAYARIQGKSALVSHFQNSSLMNEDKRCRPILFHTEGPNAGDQEPFPMGSNIRSRPGKPRSSNEGYNQFNSSASENQDEM